MSRPLALSKFLAMPLLSAWEALDKATGTVYRHEVRRCPATGLRLTGKRPKDQPKATQREMTS